MGLSITMQLMIFGKTFKKTMYNQNTQLHCRTLRTTTPCLPSPPAFQFSNPGSDDNKKISIAIPTSSCFRHKVGFVKKGMTHYPPGSILGGDNGEAGFVVLLC